MTSKKIKILVLIGLVLALSIVIISAPDVGGGPVMMPAVEKAHVSPPVGNYTDSFNYTADVRFYEEAEIELQLHHPIQKDWITYDTQIYTGNRSWETLRWNLIPSDRAWEGENVSYRFRWDNTYLYYGKGPYIKEEIAISPVERVKFKNATVYPSKGNFSTAFNYTVEVINSGIEINNVTLEVYDEYDKSWRHEGPGTNKPADGKRWEWQDIKFGEGYEGIAKYKFRCNNEYESAVYEGPLMLSETPQTVILSGGGGGGGGGGSSYKPYMQYENANVEPDFVLISVRGRKTFDYSVEVDKNDPLILEVYNLSSNVWEEKGKGAKSKLKDTWMHEWTVNLTLNKPGYGKYRFYPEKKEKYTSQIYYGPEIRMSSVSEWKSDIGILDKELKEPEINCTVTPEEEKWFKKFTYTATIDHPDRANMTVVLFVYKPGSDDWKTVPWRGYRYNPLINQNDYDEKNTATVTWTVEKKDIFDEKDTGAASEFYIWYWDGYNEYYESIGNYPGPWLLANHEPEFVKNFKPKPETGSTHSVYEYKFEIHDPDNDTVEGLLTVIDAVGEEHVIGDDKYNEGYLTFIVGQDHDIFTRAKLERYTNSTGKAVFTSRYRLEYWDEGMIVDGKTEKEPEKGWFTGPNVTAVTVTPTKPEVKPSEGTYADEFEYRLEFYSSRENTITLKIMIYDPSNRTEPWSPIAVKDLRVAADTTEPVSWTVKPEVFGPEDAGKTARYTIMWRDIFGNDCIINGTGPYIERAVPLLSWDLPLVPALSMVLVPLFVIGASLLSIISGVPILSLLKGVSSKLRKEKAKKTEKEKEENKEEVGES